MARPLELEASIDSIVALSDAMPNRFMADSSNSLREVLKGKDQFSVIGLVMSAAAVKLMDLGFTPAETKQVLIAAVKEMARK